MKADQSPWYFFGLPRKSGAVASGNQRKFEAIRKSFAAALKRLKGTDERLRATLGDETD